LLCHGTVCVVGKMRDLILQLSKSSIYSTKPVFTRYLVMRLHILFMSFFTPGVAAASLCEDGGNIKINKVFFLNNNRRSACDITP
ncbi:hypothetical protein P9955_11175, partial [Serratia nevei]|nr:hypothetical protein [Serratia nevei]MDK5273217.1 hypothetical protein [Serratia nevei]